MHTKHAHCEEESRHSARLLARVSAIALFAAIATLGPYWSGNSDDGVAWAASHVQGAGGGHDGGDDHGDDHGSKGNGPQAGKAGEGAQGSGQGQGAPDPDSEGRGPQYGKSDEPKGGKPVWAQEGIPEVELGRLNVARSPDHVLQRAYDEALSTFTSEMVDFYNMDLNEAIEALTFEFDDLTLIDSPLQNLALLKDALDGSSVLNDLPEVNNSVDVLSAVFLGMASDKTVEITDLTAYAVAKILGYELTEAEADALAADAEAIRIAVLAGHG